MKVKKSKIKKIIKTVLKENEEKKERIVDRIIAGLKTSGITGTGEALGLIDQVDNHDEFEDLIRYIVDASGLSNDAPQMYQVLKSIADDFKNDPDNAASFSKFNIG